MNAGSGGTAFHYAQGHYRFKDVVTVWCCGIMVKPGAACSGKKSQFGGDGGGGGDCYYTCCYAMYPYVMLNHVFADESSAVT